MTAALEKSVVDRSDIPVAIPTIVMRDCRHAVEKIFQEVVPVNDDVRRVVFEGAVDLSDMVIIFRVPEYLLRDFPLQKRCGEAIVVIEVRRVFQDEQSLISDVTRLTLYPKSVVIDGRDLPEPSQIGYADNSQEKYPGIEMYELFSPDEQEKVSEQERKSGNKDNQALGSQLMCVQDKQKREDKPQKHRLEYLGLVFAESRFTVKHDHGHQKIQQRQRREREECPGAYESRLVER